MTDPCSYSELLSAYLDDELAVHERWQVEAHLGRHDECRTELDGLASIRQAVRSLPWLDGPAEMWARLGAAAPAPADEQSTPAAPVSGAAPVAALAPRVGSRSFTWAAAVAALLMVAAGVAGTQVDGSSPSVSVSVSPTPPTISEVRTGNRTLASTTAFTVPAVETARSDHDHGGVRDAMDGVVSFLRVP